MSSLSLHCYISAGSRRPLKQATVPLVGLSTCRRPDWLGKEFILSDRMICAGEELGGVDTCQVSEGDNMSCDNESDEKQSQGMKLNVVYIQLYCYCYSGKNFVKLFDVSKYPYSMSR